MVQYYRLTDNNNIFLFVYYFFLFLLPPSSSSSFPLLSSIIFSFFLVVFSLLLPQTIHPLLRPRFGIKLPNRQFPRENWRRHRVYNRRSFFCVPSPARVLPPPCNNLREWATERISCKRKIN